MRFYFSCKHCRACARYRILWHVVWFFTVLPDYLLRLSFDKLITTTFHLIYCSLKSKCEGLLIFKHCRACASYRILWHVVWLFTVLPDYLLRHSLDKLITPTYYLIYCKLKGNCEQSLPSSQGRGHKEILPYYEYVIVLYTNWMAGFQR